MAAVKEALAIVLDATPSMCDETKNGPSPFQQSIDCINMILQRKIFSEAKDEVALVVFGTDETSNTLAIDDEEYQNIAVVREIGLVDWEFVDVLQNKCKGGTSADFIDALVVAMDILYNATRGKRFGSKRIILFSNFGSEFSTDQLDNITTGMKEVGIVFNVIGPSLDKDDSEKPQKDVSANGKTVKQNNGEVVAQKLLQDTGGDSFSFSEANEALNYFTKRNVRPSPWKVQLQIGPSLKISVCKYIKIREFKPKSWKNAYAKEKDAGIQVERSYHKNDLEQTTVEKDETVAAFRYGSSIVIFTEEDKENMAYKSSGKCLSVLGFTKMENVKQYHFLGDGSCYVVADKENETGVIALSAFIQALYETQMAAIVHYCYSERSSPNISCLIPQIKADKEVLVLNQLPFMEDLRLYTFTPLTAKSKNLPSEEQLAVIDKLISDMDLSSADVDEDGDSIEALKAKNICNPFIQRLFQCCLHRVKNPSGPLPEPDQQMLAILSPPKQVADKCKAICDRLQSVFNLQVVEKRSRVKDAMEGKASDEPDAKIPCVDPLSLRSISTLGEGPIMEIGTIKPSEDFLALISRDRKEFASACRQLQKVIMELVMDSVGEIHARENYKKVLKCLKTFREESLKESATVFNDFIIGFKATLLSKGKSEFWKIMKGEAVYPIAKEELSGSKITKEEANKFYEDIELKPNTGSNQPAAEDADELLAMM